MVVVIVLFSIAVAVILVIMGWGWVFSMMRGEFFCLLGNTYAQWLSTHIGSGIRSYLHVVGETLSNKYPEVALTREFLLTWWILPLGEIQMEVTKKSCSEYVLNRKWISSSWESTNKGLGKTCSFTSNLELTDNSFSFLIKTVG